MLNATFRVIFKHCELGVKLGATRTCRHLYITELKMKAFRHFLKAFVNPLCWYKGQWRQGFLNDYQKLSWLCHFVKMYCMKLFLNKVPSKKYTMNHFMSESTKATLDENHQKCRIWIFQFWHFPPIFVLLKVTCLVTLLGFQKSPKWTNFWHF